MRLSRLIFLFVPFSIFIKSLKPINISMRYEYMLTVEFYCTFRTFWPRAQCKCAHLLTIHEYQIHAIWYHDSIVYGGFSNLFDFGLDSVVSVLPLCV